MEQCPGCHRAAKTSERIEPDLENKKKMWLITFCAKCGYNYNLEEYKDKVLSPEQEMDKYPWPDEDKKENKHIWPKF